MLVADPYYMPLVPALIDQVGRVKFLSKIDLSKGFYQVPLTEQVKDWISFITLWGKFRFTRMPFGLRNAPATLQRLMGIVPSGLNTNSSAYIDDILIFSPNWEDHVTHCHSVLERLHSHGLKAKPSKCVWDKSHVEYLGFEIGGGQVTVPEARVAPLMNYKKPITQRDLRSFLGTVGYYRRFVQNFGKIAASLTAATRKNMPRVVEWTSAREKSFSELKLAVASICAQCIPSLSDVFMLTTDASFAGIGAVLSVTREGVDLPVAFYSRQLRDRETCYTATELECLGVVEAIRHFEVYLVGSHFTLVMDHHALQFELSNKWPNRCLTRWSLFLQGFSFTYTYITAGRELKNADGLSRQIWLGIMTPMVMQWRSLDRAPHSQTVSLHVIEVKKTGSPRK